MVSPSLFSGNDELGTHLRRHDWRTSPLGPPASWPAAIRTVVRLMQDAKHAMFVFWGPELGLLYNQSYVEFLQDKHPRALGRPFREVWPVSATILLVDDETALRQVLAEVLRDAGHTVFEGGDAGTALAKLRHIDRVDLLVTDIGLPGGMNGRQLADAVLGAHPATRVLFITGYAEAGVMDGEPLAADAQRLIKPFALKDFVAAVAGIVAGLAGANR